MAFDIVKHRRGTTKEWLAVDLVPEDGELVIEECSDGTRKCKIGNGIDNFTKLPYIDHETQNKLLAAIDKLRTDFGAQLDSTNNSLTEQISETKQEFTEAIAYTTETLQEDYKSRDTAITEKLQSKITKSSEELRAEIVEGLNIVTTKLGEKTDLLKSNFESSLSDTSEKLSIKIDQVIEDTKADAQNAVAELDKKFTAKLAAETFTRENRLKDVNDNITALETSIKEEVQPSIERLDSKLASAVEELASKHSTDLKQLSDTLDSKANSIEESISTHTKSVEDKLTSLSMELSSDYTSKISEAQQTIQETIDNVSVNQAEALATLRKDSEYALSSAEVSWLEKLSKLKDDLLAADAVLAATVSSLAEQGKVFSEETLTNLDHLHQKVLQLAETDTLLQNKITEVDGELTKNLEQLATELTSVSQQQASDYAELLAEISRIEEAQKVADLGITDLLLEQITKVYMEIADLVDDDITVLKRVFAVQSELSNSINSVDNRLSGELTALEQSLTGQIETTEQNLSKNIGDVQALLAGSLNRINQSLTENLETLRANTNLRFSSTTKSIENLAATVQELDDSIAGRFEDVATEIADNKTEAEQTANDFNEQLEEVNSRIDAANSKIALQAFRLNGMMSLPAGSTKGDAELMDIRKGYDGLTHDTAGDAVRAIGQDLDDLKASLPSYIPDNAIDGLYYEGDQLWLTSKDELVGDPVTITGGGGGGGSTSTVRVQSNLASTSFTVSKGNEAWIDFTYTSYENEVPTGSGTFIITINNKRIDALSGTIQHNVSKRINVAEYLKNGANSIKVTCTDQYGTSRSLVFNISVIELLITSNFDSTRIYEDTITFRYKVAGQVAKTVHILLDGEEIESRDLSASVNNREATINIPKQSHGCHNLVAYMTATLGSDEIRSNTLRYEFLCIETNRKEAMVATIFEQKTATQGDLLSIPFLVYDPSTLTADVDLIVYSKVSGVIKEYSRTTASVGRELAYWNTRQYPTGEVIFKISYSYSYFGEIRTIEKTHTLSVEALQVDISPEEDGLQLYLTSQGRANTDAVSVRDKWTYNSTNPNEPIVTTVFEDFNWKTNGWVEDSEGDVCLRLNGDARATINFAPFKNDFKQFGKTLEFEFAVRDVNSRDAVVIDCFDGTRGFRATPDTAFLQSSGPKVSCRFKDEERIRVAISVEHSDSGSKFVSIYLDGILSGVQKYTDNDIFSQVNALPITLGSNLCGVDIYNIRVYDKALSTAQVLNNYIADKAEPTTKLKLMTDNDILDEETGELSYQRVKELGQIPIITFTGSMPTFKGDKKKNSVYVTFEDPAHPELNFEKVLLKEIDVQGTSSAGYVRKNWKLKFNDAIQHMPGAIPAKVFCIKVDYAEATGTHNTGTANYVETLYDRNQSIIPAQLDDPRVRTTIQGFPCVLFEKATEDSEPKFSSKGNFNYDKGAEAVFGFTDKYDDFGVECWEFCNNISDAVSFLGPVPDDWKDDFEPRYTPIPSMDDPDDTIFDDIEGLIEARTNAEKGDGVFTDAQQTLLSSLQAECIKNFKEMHDWVLSTATYKVEAGNRIPIVPKNDATASELPDADKYLLETPAVIAKTTYLYDTEEYRLAKFKNEFPDHFDMHYSTMYYVFTLFALMVDQRAKNMFLTRWKNTDGKYRWYPYFYDNDTIFGINNVGALVFDYFHEDIDQIASADVYNGQNSTLWNNFRLCFANEIESLYRTLRSDDKITYDVIIDQYVTKGSDKWNAAIYNADAEYKYVSMARPDENGAFDANNLKQVRGPGEHHLRYFIANRLDYCDSKWYAGDYPSDQIVVRLYTPKITEITDSMTDEQKVAAEASNARILESLSVVPASSEITVTPYSNMYAGIAYASGTRQQKRLNKGEQYTFTAPEGVNTNDAETSIYGASMLSSLGDLSNLYCDYLDLSKATKLMHLKIGHESPLYHNDNIKSVTLGRNRLLKTLDVRNCSGLGVAGDDKILNITGCQNIETVLAEGTNLTSISLPSGGYIKTLHLPSSISTLAIQDHQHITDFSIESYENVKTLRIENCPTLDTKAMLEACKKDGKYTVDYVYLTGFNWGNKENPIPVDFIKGLFPVFEDGKLVSGVLGIKANGETTTDPAFLDGTCYVAEITGADYAEIKSKFPYLNIHFGKMISTVTFRYKDAAGNSYEKSVEVEGIDSTLATCTVPALIPRPSWPENDAFSYELAGWSEMEQISKGTEDSEHDCEAFPDALNGSSLKNIAGNRTLYPVFRALRKSYEIRFINPTKKNNNLLQTVMTPYGYDAKYTGPVPTKQDAASPELYEHTGWYPKPEKIKGPMTCEAQFSVLDDKWYKIGILDITDCVDHNGKVFNGYTLNTDDNTMSITECNNYYNPAVLVPGYISFENGTFRVVSFGGFANHTTLELISFPESLIEIQNRAFDDCYNLFELTLPEALQKIGREAFSGCVKIKTLFIPASVNSIGEAAFARCKGLTEIKVAEGNKRYRVVQNCLIDSDTGTLLQGLSSGTIPQDGSILKLGHYCFSNTDITSTWIPDNIKTISNNAFSNCKSLTSVSLPDKLETLDATCFAWCSNLSAISLPEGLLNIRTYVFDACALSNVTIPSTVETVLERSFGDMTSLRTVTFKKRVNADGTVKVPTIDANAFINSGTAEHPVEFWLPWSADKTPDAPWGATNAILHFEEDTNNA